MNSLWYKIITVENQMSGSYVNTLIESEINLQKLIQIGGFDSSAGSAHNMPFKYTYCNIECAKRQPKIPRAVLQWCIL